MRSWRSIDLRRPILPAGQVSSPSGKQRGFDHGQILVRHRHVQRVRPWLVRACRTAPAVSSKFSTAGILDSKTTRCRDAQPS